MRIAIVGTGISGLVCGSALAPRHELHVFEAADYIGGHTNTVDVPADMPGQTLPIDTGFIVFNDFTYPNFCAMIAALGVRWQPTDMSFSVQCERDGLEYCGSNLNTLFAQRRNLLRPAFHRMLRDILRFNREAPQAAANGHAAASLRDYLHAERFSREFIDRYIIPMGAAIWSADPGQFDRIPLRFFVQFFEQHGMLRGMNRRPWRTITGGARAYVALLVQPFRNRIRLRAPIESIRRFEAHVELTPRGGAPERFDQVVLALHSDQALRCLADASEAERQILSAIRYQANQAVLHGDPRLLPSRRRAWAAWNYFVPARPSAAPAVSYYMNALQSLPTRRPWIVSLNRGAAIDAASIARVIEYHHPVFTAESVAAQQRWAQISGVRRTHYCGAYWGFGFHEDGVRSALRVCDALQARPSWAPPEAPRGAETIQA